MADINSLLGLSGSNQSQLDLLVQSYKMSQQSRIDNLEEKKSTLETRRNFFNSLNSKVNSLIGNIDTFTAENASDSFKARSVTSSDSSVLTASAETDAILGLNQVFVERLATNDLLISDQLDLSGSFGMSGTQDFEITVGGETAIISVDFEGSETNEEAMTKIVNAINNEEDLEVSASVIKNTSSTARLTLTSSETGAENQILFTESALSQKLGFDAGLGSGTTDRTVATDTGAGYQKANYENLDAELTVNGINVTRGSNSIDDLLSGITLNLLKPQEEGDQAVTLTTDVDTDSVADYIQPLLDNYNSIISFLQSNKTIQRTDTIVTTLYTNIRGISSQSVSGTEDDYKFLTEIGIDISSDGRLSIGDKDELEEALENDPQKVANLFTSENSFVAKLNSAIEFLTGDDGLIRSRTLSLNDQIDSTVERTEELEAQIDRQAEALRSEYEDTLRVYLEAQAQYSMLGSYSSSVDTSGMIYY